MEINETHFVELVGRLLPYAHNATKVNDWWRWWVTGWEAESDTGVVIPIAAIQIRYYKTKGWAVEMLDQELASLGAGVDRSFYKAFHKAEEEMNHEFSCFDYDQLVTIAIPEGLPGYPDKPVRPGIALVFTVATTDPGHEPPTRQELIEAIMGGMPEAWFDPDATMDGWYIAAID